MSTTDNTGRRAANAPELVIAMVTPLGIDHEQVTGALSDQLKLVDYEVESIHLMDELQELGQVSIPSSITGIKRIDAKIKAGDDLCRRQQRKDTMALWAINLIFERRRTKYERTRRGTGREDSAPDNDKLLAIPTRRSTGCGGRKWKARSWRA
jgi:hypothetical protein